jgi:hypothetical protein
MFSPKLIFWLLVGVFISLTLSPDTIVKVMTVYWLGLVGLLGFVRFLFWYGKRKGAVTVTWTNEKGDE